MSSHPTDSTQTLQVDEDDIDPRDETMDVIPSGLVYSSVFSMYVPLNESSEVSSLSEKSQRPERLAYPDVAHMLQTLVSRASAAGKMGYENVYYTTTLRRYTTLDEEGDPVRVIGLDAVVASRKFSHLLPSGLWSTRPPTASELLASIGLRH